MRRRRLLFLAAAVVLLLWAGAHAGTALVVAAPVTDPDAVVSLASHEWERLPAAVAIAMQNPHASIILTRPTHVTAFSCHDCGNRVAILVHAGVPENRIQVVPIPGDGTYAEAVASRRFAEHAGIRRLVVVTSPYHTRRSLAAFRAVFAGTGIRTGIAPATPYSPARPDRWWSTPYDRWYVAYEWAAMLYYVVRHGVIPAIG